MSEAMSKFVYVTFIKTTPEELWEALTTPAFMRQYWFGMHCESEFTPGSAWRLLFEDGRAADSGEILESAPPARLVIKWRNEFREELKAEGFTRCSFDISLQDGATKLVVTHESALPDSKTIAAVSGGWPRILSNLKSLLETGMAAMPVRL